MITVAVLAAVFVFPKNTHRSGQLLGMIVPHHDLVWPLMEDMFEEASAVSDPDVIVLVGPNHKNRGEGLSITTQSDFTTELGPLPNERDITQSLIDHQLAQEDFDTLREEHSITTLLPLVRQYFPNAHVVPVVLRAEFSPASAEELAGHLVTKLQGKEVLFVASIDFSHYLPSDVAPQKDEVTKTAIKERNRVQIARMNSDYLDSGPTLLTLLSFLEHFGIVEDELVHHTNSGLFVGERVESSTSYLMYRFWKRDETLDKT